VSKMDFFSILLYFFIGVGVLIVGFFILLAFTTGFRRSGRLMGGLFALIGKPGEGKSYCGTYFGLVAMIKEKRRCFSNYAIVSEDVRM